MSLQTRLAELIAAIGADIKAIPNARTGWGPPTNAVGKTGEYYVDMSNLDVYGPKAALAPKTVTGLVGQLHQNPSVEANFTGYSVSASAGIGAVGVSERTQDRAQDGTWSYHSRIERVDSANASLLIATQQSGLNGMAVDPTKPYSVSLRLYMRALALAGSNPGRIRIFWYKADGSASAVSTSTIEAAGSENVPIVGTWVEEGMENFFPPSDAAFMRYTLYPGSAPASGDYIFDSDIDSVVVVQATSIPKWGAPIGKLFASVAPSRVTVLPVAPVDGQEVYYVADAANSVEWHLRYSTATNKWEFVGGSDLYAEDLANRASLNNSPNYGALATALQVVVPLAGTYDVEYSVGAITTGTNTGAFSDIAWGANVGNDQNAAVMYLNTGTLPRQAVHKKRRITCAAGDTVALVHKAGVTTITFHARTLSIKPVSVS